MSCFRHHRSTHTCARETRRFRHRQAGDRRRYLPLVMELASRATAHYGAHHTAGRQQPAGGRHFGEAAPPTSPSPTAPPGVPAHLRDLWRRVWCASPPVRPDRIRAPPAATGGRKDQPRVSACDGSVSMRGVRTGPQLQCPAERRYLATSSRSAGFRSVLYVWLRCAILLQHLVVAVSHSRGCSFCAPRVAGGVQV